MALTIWHVRPLATYYFLTTTVILQHAVWGNGDERWYKTYMNVPRVLDSLLERC